MLTRFQNSCLLSTYPSISRVVNHEEAPRSVFKSLNLHWWPVMLDVVLVNFCYLYSCLSCLLLFLLLFIVSFWILHDLFCCVNIDTCSSVNSNEFWIPFPKLRKKIFIFIQPSLVASDVEVVEHFLNASSCEVWCKFAINRVIYTA